MRTTPPRPFISFALSLLVSILAAIAIYYALSAYVFNKAEGNIRDVLLAQRGLHLYIQKIMHPEFYRSRDQGEVSTDYYSPEVLSSSFIVRNMTQFYNEERKRMGMPEIYYKMASDNPRNPVNKADVFESNLIRKFNNDKGLKEYRDIIRINGKKYLYYAIPFLETNKACLRCHGNREDAPPGLQARYSGQGGFGEKVGNIRAIEFIRVPIEEELNPLFIVSGALAAGLLFMISLAIFNARLRDKVKDRTNHLVAEISERMKVAESLQLFKNLLDESNDCIFIIDPATARLLDVNKHACNALGYIREEMLSLCVMDVDGNVTDIRAWSSHVQDVRVKGSALFESNHRRKDGSLLPVEINVKYVPLESGNFMLAVVRDITERKRAEELHAARLRLMEFAGSHSFHELLQKALDEVCALANSPIGFYHFVESDQRTLSLQAWSTRTLQEFCQAKGYGMHYSVDEAGVWVDCVRQRRPVIHNDYISLPDRKGMPEGHPPVVRELVVPILRDDRVVAILGVGNKFTDYTEEDLRMVSFLADVTWEITRRKASEESLSGERERLSVTLRSIGDGVITTDFDGNIVLINRMAEELTGWTQEEACGKPLAEVFHIINEITRERCQNPVDQVLKTGAIVELANHTVLIHRDGKELTIADSGAPIRDSQSRIIGVVLVFRDTTEKERSKQALQNAQKLEAVGMLAAGIAHDFNNLLSGLFNYIDLARDLIHQNDGEKASQTLERAVDVYDRARHLTNTLLTFSKGGLPIRKPASIAELVRKTVTFALSGSNVTPSFSIADGIWPCSVDENQIAQVLDNIVINARQAMPLGGKLEITLKNILPKNAPISLPAKDYVCIAIKDSGTGIVKEHLSQVFLPFFTTKQQGSGLGLATSYAIVQKHDGTIEVESEIGKGSTFFIYLQAAEQPQPLIAEKDTVQARQGRGRVLVMDDEVFMLDVLSMRLTEQGFEVTAVENGDQAVEFAKEAWTSGRPFNFAILDLTIPGGRGGKDIARELIEITPEIKLVASSGYSNDPVMANPEEYGFAERLVKPYRKDDLIGLMNALLGELPPK